MSFRIPNWRRRCNHLNRDIEPDFLEVATKISNRAIAISITLAGSSSICVILFFKACPQILKLTLHSFVGTRGIESSKFGCRQNLAEWSAKSETVS